MANALELFIGRLIDERDALNEAVHQDAEALKYAAIVWSYRQQPVTLLAEGELSPEQLLQTRTHAYKEETIAIPAIVTEDDIKRYQWRQGSLEGWCPASRTAALRQEFGPQNGFPVTHELLRKAIEEAKTDGMAAQIGPLLTAAYEAHEALVEAACQAADDGARHVGTTMTDHCEAIAPLMMYLPAASRLQTGNRDRKTLGLTPPEDDDHLRLWLMLAAPREPGIPDTEIADKYNVIYRVQNGRRVLNNLKTMVSRGKVSDWKQP